MSADSPSPGRPPPAPADNDLRAVIDGTLGEVERERIELLFEDHPEHLEQLEQLSEFAEFRDDYLRYAPKEIPVNSPLLVDLIGKLKANDFSESPVSADELAFLDEPIGADGEPGRLGNYRIDRVAAHGGMGLVLEAHDRDLDRRIAIKALAPDLSAIPKARDLFLSEARAAASLDHPNLLPIHSVEPGHAVPYFVMPYIDGPNLQELVSRDRALPVARAIDIGKKIARGLAAAHAAGLVHRDIKPANILLDEGGGRVWVADFGVAQAAGSLRDSVTGTPQFMAPEQAAGKQAGEAADLFSLGCVLFFALTGRPPFRRTVPGDPFTGRPPAKTLNPAVPGWLDRLIDKLLQEDPRDRPSGAAEVANLLEENSRRRLWPIAATVVALLSIAVGVPLAANERGFVGAVNQMVGKFNGQRFWIEGEFGTHHSLADAVANTVAGDGGATIVVEGSFRANQEPIVLPAIPLTIRSAPGELAELHQIDFGRPMLSLSGPLVLENITLHRVAVNPVSAPLIKLDSQDLTLRRCEIIAAQKKSKMWDRDGVIEVSGESTVEVSESVLLFSKASAFRLPPDKHGGMISIRIEKSFVGGFGVVLNMGAPDRELDLDMRQITCGARTILLASPLGPRNPTHLNAENSIFSTSAGLVWLPSFRREQLPEWLRWRGRDNLYSQGSSYMLLTMKPSQGTDTGNPDSPEEFAAEPWTDDEGAADYSLEIDNVGIDDPVLLRDQVLEWTAAIRASTTAWPGRGVDPGTLSFSTERASRH